MSRAKTPGDTQLARSTDLGGRHPWLRVPDLIAINVIVMIAAAAAVVSMMESYTNLLDFAENHQLHGWRADIAPGSVDAFIIIGEFLLFVAVYRGWNTYRELGKFKMPAAMVSFGWALAIFGFTLSVFGNLGHLHTADLVTRLMSAVFPVSATVAMAAVLMILKRVVKDHQAKVAAQADIRPHHEVLYMLGGFLRPQRPLTDIRSHGELLGMLGGFPAPITPPTRQKPVSSRRKPPAVAPPQTTLLSPPAALTAAPEPPPGLPRMVPDPAPRDGQVSRPIEITSEIWTALESGVPAQKLAAEHPELGSAFRVKQIVKAHQEGRLGHGQLVDEVPVVVVPDREAVPGGE